MAAAGILTGSAIALSLPGLGATSIVSEREMGRLDLLRGSALSSVEIVKGKLGAVLLGGLRFFILGGVYLAAIVAIALLGGTVGPTQAAFQFVAGSAAVALASPAGGLLASTLARSSLQALVMAYSLCACQFLLAPWWIGLFDPSRDFLHRLNLTLVLWLSSGALEFLLAVLVFEKRWMRDP